MGGRPSKSIEVSTAKISKEDKKIRLETEKKLQGKCDAIEPFNYLNERQNEIFYFIINNLQESKILSNLDVYILNQMAISIERLEFLESQINENPLLMFETKYKNAHETYMKDFFKGCNELCLSPQSRAKISINAVPKKDEKKTLTDILGDDDDE